MKIPAVVFGTRFERKQKWLCLGWVCLIITVTIRFQWLLFGSSPDTDKPAVSSNVVSTGGFQFARLRYSGGVRGYAKNWYTDYPAMDRHLTTLLERMTDMDVGLPKLVTPSAPTIFSYPLIYTVEPEQMVLGDDDVRNMREYLARGGFWFADDFHGEDEFNQFLRQIRRVLPDAPLVELDTSHPLFHCFFDIDTIVQVTNDGIAKCRECNQWENGPSGKVPRVFAILDKFNRITILMAWNTDLGDGLEWADDPEYPENYSAFAFRFMSNVIVYAMNH